MISIAHADFRDELEREARGHGLIPKGFAMVSIVRYEPHSMEVQVGAAEVDRLFAQGTTWPIDELSISGRVFASGQHPGVPATRAYRSARAGHPRWRRRRSCRAPYAVVRAQARR